MTSPRTLYAVALLLACTAGALAMGEPTIETENGGMTFSADSFNFNNGSQMVNLFTYMGSMQGQMAEMRAQMSTLQAKLAAKQDVVTGTCEQKAIVSISPNGSVDCSDDVGTSKGTVVANYRNDFMTPSPKSGWQYLFNNGAIGDSSTYLPFTANPAKIYSFQGQSIPANTPRVAYAQLKDVGGHPGQSAAQQTATGGTSAYPIAAFTISANGIYMISDSYITDIKAANCGTNTDGLKLRVYVNDALKYDTNIMVRNQRVAFDTVLGSLKTTDVVYVAVGSEGTAGCDSFEWDFSLRSFPLDNQLAVAIASLNRGSIIDTSTATANDCEASDYGALRVSTSATDPLEVCTSAGWSVLAQSSALGNYQQRVTGSCSAGTAINTISSSGSVSCANYTVDSSLFQRRLQGSCGENQFVQQVGESGALTCGTAKSSSARGSVVASFRDDYQNGGFPANWRYLLATGDVDDPSSYVPLMPSTYQGGSYTFNGSPSLPAPSPGFFAYLVSNGGHPGSPNNPVGSSGAVIVEYTTTADGYYMIANAYAENTNDACGDGISMMVIVNTNTTIVADVPNGETDVFNGNLGFLSANTPVRVAVFGKTSAGCDSIDLDFQLRQTPAPAVIVASYIADFQNPPKQGWSYLSGAMLGDASTYTPLKWDGTNYDLDGNPNTDNANGNYLKLNTIASNDGSHPGNTGDPTHEFAIAAFQVADTGHYFLNNALISDMNSDCGGGIGDGVELFVYVDSTQIASMIVPNGFKNEAFNFDLGVIRSLATVYVAVGPGAQNNFCDAFYMDFSIVQLISG